MNFTGKENKSLVSVILPAYNSENTILYTLQSVVDQSYCNWELIIINDGSVDNTVSVIKEFRDSLASEVKDKIHVCSIINSGPSYARNFGIEKASGEFIAFVDSDDVWDHKKLEIQIEYAYKFSDCGIISGGFDKIDFPQKEEYKILAFKDILKKNFFSTPTVLISKEKLGNHRFDVCQKYSEDYKLWLELSILYKNIYINRILARNALGKFNYGVSGLSSNLWQMEKGELSNYKMLYKSRKISLIKFLLYLTFSYLKYLRRLYIIKIKFNEK